MLMLMFEVPYQTTLLFLFSSTLLPTLFFFYKNLFYKNVEAEICQNFKNMLRTYPGWDFAKNFFTLSSYL